MLQADTQSIVNDLVPLLRQFTGTRYGIAVGGAHAKGVADSESDLDLYLFCTDVLADERRTALASAHSSRIHDVVSWHVGDPFEQAGTDFLLDDLKVECWLRSSEMIDHTVTDCVAGHVTRTLVYWTTTGFYNYCALSDLKVMIPVDDPSDLLAGWKQRVAVYPPRLRQAIIDQHLREAAFWPHNFHYASAIERADVIYTTGIVQKVCHNLIQVLFALNETYFGGDKKVAKALRHLQRVPGNCAERIDALLFPGQPVSVSLLRAQQEELQALLGEVQALVEKEVG